MNRINFFPESTSNPISLEMGDRCGDRQFGCTSVYLEKDGKPWLPVMGEFHFSRYDCEEWELELRKMKAGGVDIVATYLFWIFHEEEKGHFCFEGNRDISRFLSLCKKVGLYAFPRIGPWCHGECRNGGFPDWLQNSGISLRSCDERYLAYVRRLFAAFAEQIRPWLFRNGGPVIGIQLENELTEDEAYLTVLKRIAVECGILTPYYTVTGWGFHVTEFPSGEMLPVFGAYPAAPWEDHVDPLPPNKNYFFSAIRNDSSIGSDLITGTLGEGEERLRNLPFITCELGAGNQLTYHRRPTISTMDGVAISLIKLGSGNNLPGYYMYHGGFNPPEGVYQESKASGYPNDLPVSSYDFQAPLGEYGQPRQSFFHLKRLHQFVHCCGEQLAAMPSYLPDIHPATENDVITPRLAMRSDGKGGFLFFSTHQRNIPFTPTQNLFITVHFTSGEEATYGPMDIPASSCGVFPIRQSWFGVPVEFMTMQPLWVGLHEGKPTLVCSALEGIAPMLELRGDCIVRSGQFGSITREGNRTYVCKLPEGKGCQINLEYGEASLCVIALSDMEGLQFYPVKCGGETKLLFSDGILYEQDGHIKAYGTVNAAPQAQELCDAVRLVKAEDQKIGADNPFAQYLFTKAELCPEYVLQIPTTLSEAAYDAIITINAKADVIQLYANQTLVADDYLRSEPWNVSLRRLAPYIRAGQELRIKCSPITSERKVYLDTPVSAGAVEISLADICLIDILEVEDK